MNKERIAELREFDAAATPGPWTTSSAWSVRSGRDELVAATSYYNHEADAEFIAAARTAVPELLDEIERLTAERGALRAALREYGPKCAGWLGEKTCSRSAVARDPYMDGAAYGWCDVHRIERARRDFAHVDVLRSLNEESGR